MENVFKRNTKEYAYNNSEENNSFESDIIKHTVKENIEYIQFKELLKYKEVNHAYILKTNSMDFRSRTNFRNIENVIKNLKVVSDEIGFDFEKIIRPDYNHTNNVAIINEVKPSEVPSLRGEDFKDTDGLITDKSNIALMSTNADCNLILIYDPIKKVIANVHAGWRGTFSKIAKNAISKMKLEYKCNPEDILCFFCPSIRKCHFEVDVDVYEECKKIFSYTNRLNEIIEKGEIKERKQKYNIDLVLINKILLEEEGIPSKNIIDCGICSVCNSDKIHSARAEGPSFGLSTAIIEKQ